MAEISPTNQSNNSGESPEEKPVSSPAPKPADPSVSQEGFLDSLLTLLPDFAKWCGRNPIAALALAIIAGTLTYFFGIFHPFKYGTESLAHWSWTAWNPGGNQSHGRLVPLIALGLMLYHRDELKKVSAVGCNRGLIPLLLGIVLFVLSVRSMNSRMALFSIPLLVYGGTRFAWGREAARILLFPCAFLLFMIPVGALEQATNSLQFVIIGVIKALSPLFGVSIMGSGTSLTATDGAFKFDIAEGCSGIRSLMAMTMLTAVFVHLTQDRLWKKLTIFSCSVVIAIIGNVGRIFSAVLVAKYYDPKVAFGIYHDNVGYVSFIVAIGAMLLLDKLVNLDFKAMAAKAAAKAKTVEKEPTSYDY